MQLALAEGWTQVSPRDTPYTLVVSDQNPGQRLIAVNTAFTRRKDLGFSGGTNCPIAVDRSGERIFYSGESLTSLDLRSGGERHFVIDDAFGIYWMLTYQPDPPGLVMLLDGVDPKVQFLGHLDLTTGALERRPLSAEAFSPLAVDIDRGLALFSTRRAGAAVCDLSGAAAAKASLALSPYVDSGCFAGDEDTVVLGGQGLVAWNARTGAVTTLSPTGRYPQYDRQGDLWFCTEDGNLCRMRRDGSGFDVIVELCGVDPTGWGYAQPIVFSPDGRFGLARLTGKSPRTGRDLVDAEAFCRHHNQPFDDHHRHHFHHFFCILDLDRQEVWCHDGYAHNLAWVAGDWTV